MERLPYSLCIIAQAFVCLQGEMNRPPRLHLRVLWRDGTQKRRVGSSGRPEQQHGGIQVGDDPKHPGLVRADAYGDGLIRNGRGPVS